MTEMGAADFKAHCLQVMDKVRQTRQGVVITKRGVPVAKLVPVDPPKAKDIFGCMAGEFEIVGDPTVSLHSDAEWHELDRQRAARWSALEGQPTSKARAPRSPRARSRPSAPSRAPSKQS